MNEKEKQQLDKDVTFWLLEKGYRKKGDNFIKGKTTINEQDARELYIDERIAMYESKVGLLDILSKGAKND